MSERDRECGHPVMRPGGLARNRLLPGTVVLACVPFAPEHADEAEPAGAKFRPVVVMRLAGDECVCRPCYSAESRLRYPWAYTEVHDLACAGLSRHTGVRHREVNIPVEDCIDVLGALSDDDLACVLGAAPSDPGDGDPSAGDPAA